jgi:(2Fe-2S) ferredoxin
MPKPTHHILVCTQTRPPDHPRGSCSANGSKEVFMRFMMETARLNLVFKLIVTESSCMGPCAFGPTVVVYPDGIWYQKVSANDVAEILEQHIMKGQPVQRLLLPDAVWGP